MVLQIFSKRLIWISEALEKGFDAVFQNGHAHSFTKQSSDIQWIFHYQSRTQANDRQLFLVRHILMV